MGVKEWTSGNGICEIMNAEKIAAYLTEKIPGFTGPLKTTAFAEGQSNPTFRLTTPNARYVLRKKPPGNLLRSAHAVDREFRVQRALWDTEVPVAKVLHLCEDESVLGTIFYVMEYAEGQIFWDPALPELSSRDRSRVYDEMNRVLAAIHNVDLDAAGLSDFGRPGDYFGRQIHRWRAQYQDSETDPIPEMNAMIEWLQEQRPEDDGQISLVHGDYRIDNLMFDRNSLRIIAVFDWELSTLGHPLADLAYQIMQRSMGRDWHLRGLSGLDVDTLGIPTEEKYVAAYCERRGIGKGIGKGIDLLNDWKFAKIFAFFRFAAICQGVKKRALDGNAASPDGLKVGAMVKPLAKLGAELIT
jgi:aminoglycoside phosphotransferase (APT) family kinase protein